MDFKVSLKHLTLASDRARRMFQSDCLESQPDIHGNYLWEFDRVLDSDAFTIVLAIIHGKSELVPDKPSVRMLAEIAAVVDDLQCHSSVSFFGNTWISGLRTHIPPLISQELFDWLCISFVFKDPAIFEKATRVAIDNSIGAVEDHGLPIPPKILGMSGSNTVSAQFLTYSEDIEEARDSLLVLTIVSLHEEVDKLRRAAGGCSRECRYMMLGTLIGEMTSKKLYMPTEMVNASIISWSLAQLLNQVSDFFSPPIITSQKRDVCDNPETWERRKRDRHGYDGWEVARPTNFNLPSTVYLHSCSLEKLIEPVVDNVQFQIRGLKLEDYVGV